MWEDPGDLWSYLGLAIVSVALIVFTLRWPHGDRGLKKVKSYLDFYLPAEGEN